MSQSINGKFVNIGEYIGEEMEYMSENETIIHVSDDGKLYASINGIVKINPAKRTVTIVNNLVKKRGSINPGDYIIGRIGFERKFTVGLKILKSKDQILFERNEYGNIHVSHVSTRYIEKLDDAFKKTDYVRAKVLSKVGKEYELTTEGSHLGVIHADCPTCGTTLEKKGRDFLECPFCGLRVRRKFADDYGQVEEQIRF